MFGAMKHLQLVVACLFSGIFGCVCTGYIYNARLAESALAAVMANLATIRLIQSERADDVTAIANVWLHSDLIELREHKNHLFMAINYEPYTRVLNALALEWERNPPESIEYTSAEMTEDWQSITERNFALLEWARDECRKAPSLECRGKQE